MDKDLSTIGKGDLVLALVNDHLLGEVTVDGTVIYAIDRPDGRYYAICYLFGHHSRTDDVHQSKIVAKLDPERKAPIVRISGFRGHFIPLNEAERSRNID